MRSRPLVCSIASLSCLGAQQPTGPAPWNDVAAEWQRQSANTAPPLLEEPRDASAGRAQPLAERAMSDLEAPHGRPALLGVVRGAKNFGRRSRLGVCAVKRRRFPVGASPTRRPLQPEARADRDGTLAGFLKPDLSPAERAVTQVEG
jgi:hypothetical protein